MRRVAPPAVVGIALTLLSTAAQTQELNSERIERLFGSYGVDIVHQSGIRRVSSLYSREARQRTCRTYAIVSFGTELPPGLIAAHAEIRAGGSIGAVLKRRGWQIAKQDLLIEELELPEGAEGIATLMDIEIPTRVAMHVYRLDVKRGEESGEYATIIELHHPDHHTAETLGAVYGSVEDRLEPAARAQYVALALSHLPRKLGRF